MNKDGNILEEALRLVHGDRNADYGHPYDDYSKTTTLFNSLTGRDLTVSEGVLFMLCVKMSRLGHALKRDSLVDLAGYAEVLRIVTETEKVEAQAVTP